MSKNYGNDLQIAEIVKYISDTMKLPLIGAGGGFAPLGMYGFSCDYVLTPPQGWLFADGSIYNIADYPEYAALLASQHGRANIYGGDGVTTFATKDLRGEFIRGWGQNSHTNQGSGENVGEHQDGTEHRAVLGVSDKLYVTQKGTSETNRDSLLDSTSNYRGTNASLGGESSGFQSFTSRPTNTSVAFFVKVTLSDAEINAFHVYTPREHQVGWWEEEIDGVWKRKPVYEKRVNFGALPNKVVKSVQHNISNFDILVSLSATIHFVDGFWRTLNMTQDDNYSIIATAQVTSELAQVLARNYDLSGYDRCYITICYTKTTDQWQTS